MSFPHNTSTIPDFFKWIVERQAIFHRRASGYAKPWTNDPILRDNKFTNAYRQQDKGTVALMKMLDVDPPLSTRDIVFNVIWYRLFNHYELAELGPVRLNGVVGGPIDFYNKLIDRDEQGLKVFTSAHMTTGVAGEAKVETYIRACNVAINLLPTILESLNSRRMQTVFEALLEGYLIGRFVAYEIVCDLRFQPVWGYQSYVSTPTGFGPAYPDDTFSWANLGPGACRGLTRLGLLEPTAAGKPRYTNQLEGVEKMRYLWGQALKSLPPLGSNWPFELREIEHSLCEFDKYERIRRGEGQARVKFNGRA
jgi:hypothetical protein